ncbi:unnamed protein product, partial [Choristocarpus tenellus]
GEGEVIRAVREILDQRARAVELAKAACERQGRCQPGIHSLNTTDASSTQQELAETHEQTGTFGSAVPGPSPGCPVESLPPLAPALYRHYVLRYGLVETAESRLSALLDSVLGHCHKSPLLRIFARLMGVSSNAPFSAALLPPKTSNKDSSLALEASIADLVTEARAWIASRGFVFNGPWIGGGIAGREAGEASQGSKGENVAGAGWNKHLVKRVHAAMCAKSVLEDGWGIGHCIMGMMAQVYTPSRSEGVHEM